MSDDDLVKRLRAPDLNGRVGIRDTEAADAIERLTRERDDLDRAWIATNEELTKALARAEAAERKVEVLREALTKLLARDERNTCQHDETHRGGVLWEICDCGAQWADDEGGKPEWKDPSEWTAARAALAETEMKND